MPITTTEFRLGVDGVATVELSDGSTKTVDLANISGGSGSVDVTSMSAALNATDIAGRAAFREAGRISTFAGTVADTTALVAISNPLRIGDVVQVGSGGSANDYRLLALPSSVLGNWRNLGVSAGSGATNLTLTQTGSNVTIVSDTGTDATIPTATSTNAGVMSAAQVSALAGKQDAIVLGTNKLLAPPTTNGGAPVPITLGTNLSLSGTTLNATGGSTTVVNDLTTGGTTTALSAEMGKTLQTNKAEKMVTVSVSTAGNFDLVQSSHDGKRIVAAVAGVVFTRTTTWDTTATGCFIDVDADGTFTLSTGITIPSGAASSSATAVGGAIDLSCVDGILASKTPAIVAGYSDANALAAAVLSGALGISTTQAPTHKAVADAIGAAGGSGNVSVIAPAAFSPVAPGTSNGVLTTITVPVGAIGTRGLARVAWELLKGGTTDVINNAVRIGPIGGTAAAATSVYGANIAAANGSIAASVRIRAVGNTVRVVLTNTTPEGAATPANTITPAGVDPANGFVVYILATNGAATDTTTLLGASVTVEKVA